MLIECSGSVRGRKEETFHQSRRLAGSVPVVLTYRLGLEGALDGRQRAGHDVLPKEAGGEAVVAR